MEHGKVDFGYLTKLKGKRIPLVGDFELTKRCNLKCVHCCVRCDDADSNYQQELSTKQLFDILEQMKNSGVIYVDLSGGEPLFRPDFKDIYLFAKKKNFAVSVMTNATLITKDLIEVFKKHPPLMLEISSYGVTKDTYESVTRTPGSFAKFKKAVKLLKNSGIRFTIRLVVIKENYDEVMKNHSAIKASRISCSMTSPLLLRVDGDKAKNELIKKQRVGIKEIMEFYKKFPYGSQESRKKRFSSYRYVDSCNCNSLGGIVLSDGTFTSCHLIQKSNFNLKNSSFIEAWKSCFNGETLSSKQDIACGDCRHKSYCQWCPGIAYLETGNTKSRVPYLCSAMETMVKKNGG